MTCTFFHLIVLAGDGETSFAEVAAVIATDIRRLKRGDMFISYKHHHDLSVMIRNIYHKLLEVAMRD